MASLQDTVWNYLKGKGLPDQSIAAIMGNIQAESEFDPNLVEVGNGIGLGLCQWSYERRTQLEAYGTDVQHQLDFLWTELTGENSVVTGAQKQWIDKSGYISFNDFMHGNGSINDLTSAFCFCWERPNVSLAHLDVRQQWANTYFGTFNGQTGTGTWTGGGTTPTPTVQSVKLKNYFLHGFSDSLFGKKFFPKKTTFELVETKGAMTIIKDGELKYKVPTKNIIKI
jgi:hypothetical protein